MRRSSVRRHPTLVYQMVWIVFNCLTLVLGRGLDWITHISDQPTVNGLADWTCRVWQAAFLVVLHVVVVIVVVVVVVVVVVA